MKLTKATLATKDRLKDPLSFFSGSILIFSPTNVKRGLFLSFSLEVSFLKMGKELLTPKLHPIRKTEQI